MKKRALRKTLKTIFFATFIGFDIFMYLFATRVTPRDITYFKNDTKEKTQTLVTVVMETYTALGANKSDTASDESAEKAEESPSPVETVSEDNESKEVILKSNTLDVVYYSQTDPRWNDEIYGTDNTIGVYGCGPTALAMVLSSLTDETTTPMVAAKWAYDNGHFSNNKGSYHSIIPSGAEKHGLNCESLTNPTKQTIIDELSDGKMIVVLMKKGTFTSEGHFIILRGVTKDSKVLIADPKSLDNSNVTWDIDTILNEAKYSASYGGPFWSISKP